MRNDDASRLVSFVIGGLTGAALASLFMPRSGAWRGHRTSDDRPPAAPSAASERVPEPGLPSTHSAYESLD